MHVPSAPYFLPRLGCAVCVCLPLQVLRALGVLVEPVALPVCPPSVCLPAYVSVYLSRPPQNVGPSCLPWPDSPGTAAALIGSGRPPGRPQRLAHPGAGSHTPCNHRDAPNTHPPPPLEPFHMSRLIRPRRAPRDHQFTPLARHSPWAGYPTDRLGLA